MIQQAAQALIDGTDGAAVMAELSKTHRTLGSLNTAMSLVRAEVMSRGHLPSYDDSELRKHADNPEVVAFLDAPLKDQVAIQRAHAYRPTWSEGAEAALACLDLLPESMASFRLTNEQNLELKQAHDAALVSRNERVVTISDAEKMLKRARELLATAKTTDTFAKLVLPLALCTGRRMSELLGGHARFDRTDDPHFVLFSGQVKKRGKAAPYKIPILCDVDTLHHAYGVLRQKQAEKGVTTLLTPKEVKRKYHGQLQYYVKDGRTLPHLPTWCHFHDLRACYASYVFECFHVPTTFQRMAMAILGHESIHESLSYGHVRLQNATGLRGALGSVEM
jgi:integrase